MILFDVKFLPVTFACQEKVCALVQRHSPKYQEYCALLDKSTKIGTCADYHLISILDMEALQNALMVTIATVCKMGVLKCN